MRLLLDVNVWVALLDDAHIHNAEALKLFRQPKLAIASCALTENGVLRVLNLPGYANRAPPGFEGVRHKLALAVQHGGALATFDHRVTPSAVRGATAKHLKLL